MVFIETKPLKSCALCVVHNEEALRELPGAEKVAVNLGNGRAPVEYGPAGVTIADMKEALADAGYEVVANKMQLVVTGMTRASCVA